MATASETDRRRREVLARLFAPNGKLMPGLQETLPLSSADVAALFRMSERAIRLWAAKGELPHMRTLGGGRLLYPADEIAALYAEHYAGALPRGRNPARAPARNSRRGAS